MASFACPISPSLATQRAFSSRLGVTLTWSVSGSEGEVTGCVLPPAGIVPGAGHYVGRMPALEIVNPLPLEVQTSSLLVEEQRNGPFLTDRP